MGPLSEINRFQVQAVKMYCMRSKRMTEKICLRQTMIALEVNTFGQSLWNTLYI